MDIPKNYLKRRQKDRFLHSENHVLADELANKFGEPKRFGMYLKLAQKYNHGFLRKLSTEVLEGGADNPGALFAFLIKKHNDNRKAESKP